MAIKRILGFAILCFTVLLYGTSCSKKDKVTLNVKVKSHEESMLYLSRLDFKRLVMLDSVKISNGENTKKFRVKQGVEPTFYTLSIKNGGAITLLAEQNENITVDFDSKNMAEYKVKGSPGSLKVQTLAVTFAKSKQKIDDLSKQYLDANIPEEKTLIEKEFETAVKEQKDFNLKFIQANPMSKASVMALYQKYNDNLYLFDNSGDLLTMKTVASAWKALYPESDYTKGMVEDLDRIEKIITNSRLQKIISESEVSLPDLDIPNKNGVKIKLSSLKGKVVLLDFWLSNNTGSLLDNRELMGIYRQYKPKGFEVYQVALDVNREEWITAIETSSIPWISVCEDNPDGSSSYAAKVYNVTQIPANYLIGQDQSIIGKNLYGENLRKKLAEILK